MQRPLAGYLERPGWPVAGAWAIVVAAGRGLRFGRPKQYAELHGRPVVEWSLAAARAACGGVVLVVPADDVDRFVDGAWRPERAAAGGVPSTLATRTAPAVVVAGGDTRSASVRAGLAAVPPTTETVVVHDAARPLADAGVWARVLAAVAGGADGAVPVVPVTDTIKQVDAAGRLTTLDRSTLVAVQTPQAFRSAVLRRAHAAGGDATDDAALVEAVGGRVVAVDGDPANVKITTPRDLVVAASLLGVAGELGERA